MTTDVGSALATARHQLRAPCNPATGIRLLRSCARLSEETRTLLSSIWAQRVRRRIAGNGRRRDNPRHNVRKACEPRSLPVIPMFDPAKRLRCNPQQNQQSEQSDNQCGDQFESREVRIGAPGYAIRAQSPSAASCIEIAQDEKRNGCNQQNQPQKRPYSYPKKDSHRFDTTGRTGVCDGFTPTATVNDTAVIR